MAKPPVSAFLKGAAKESAPASKPYSFLEGPIAPEKKLGRTNETFSPNMSPEEMAARSSARPFDPSVMRPDPAKKNKLKALAPWVIGGAALTGRPQDADAAPIGKLPRVSIRTPAGATRTEYPFSVGDANYRATFHTPPNDFIQTRNPKDLFPERYVSFERDGDPMGLLGAGNSPPANRADTKAVMANVLQAMRQDAGRFDAPLGGYSFAGSTRSRGNLYRTMMGREAMPWGWRAGESDVPYQQRIVPDWAERISPFVAGGLAAATLSPGDAEGAPSSAGLGRSIGRGASELHGDALVPGGRGSSAALDPIGTVHLPKNNQIKFLDEAARGQKMVNAGKMPRYNNKLDALADFGSNAPIDPLGLMPAALGAGGAAAIVGSPMGRTAINTLKQMGNEAAWEEGAARRTHDLFPELYDKLGAPIKREPLSIPQALSKAQDIPAQPRPSLSAPDRQRTATADSDPFYVNPVKHSDYASMWGDFKKDFRKDPVGGFLNAAASVPIVDEIAGLPALAYNTIKDAPQAWYDLFNAPSPGMGELRQLKNRYGTPEKRKTAQDLAFYLDQGAGPPRLQGY